MIDSFINKIIKNQTVFILEYKDEIAVAPSVLFKNQNNEPVPVVCFWSHKAMAEACTTYWQNYKVAEICLATFIEDYLVNIYNESIIAGIDFNDKMEGVETDPLDMISALISALKTHKINLEFEYFKNLNDLENQLQKLL